MSTYDDRPWLALYEPGQPAELEIEHDTVLDAFRAAVRRTPDGDAVRYFDGRIS